MLTGLPRDYLEKQAIADLVQSTARLLDNEDFDGWLALFDDNFEYEITAYSPEIRRQMSWWKSDRTSLAKILKDIPKHVRDPGRHLHVVTSNLIEISEDTANVLSSFAAFRTGSNGESRLYVVGRYEDRLVKKTGAWRYAVHKVVLETRLLQGFTHVPL